MEEEQTRQSRRIEKMQEKYQVGNHNKGGTAFNIINLDYEKSKEGEFLKQRDGDKEVRTLLRSKHIDMLSNNGYNLVNGQSRSTVAVPEHKVYNPPGSSGSTMGKAGA